MGIKKALINFKAYQLIRSTFYNNLHKSDASFECPICQYTGVFKTIIPKTGMRLNAQCPRCGSLERHRLQYLVINELQKSIEFTTKTCLHIAPESFFRDLFSKSFFKHHTADLLAKNVDFNFDLCNIPFEDSCYDIVYASHVMEHIADVNRALIEIRRILKPGGIAVLPVPIISDKTIEYNEPNPNEEMHVRAPGTDYFQLLNNVFSKVDIFSSTSFEEQYQTWIYEDRSIYPTKTSPLRIPMSGAKHQDFVPVCYV